MSIVTFFIARAKKYLSDKHPEAKLSIIYQSVHLAQVYDTGNQFSNEIQTTKAELTALTDRITGSLKKRMVNPLYRAPTHSLTK